MKAFTRVGILILFVALELLISNGAVRAQSFNYRGCAWPLELSPEGAANVQGPDSSARYWIMPFDTTEYKTMTLKGTYPKIRYFSFSAYETLPVGFELVEKHLIDAQIVPDPGSENPFVRSQTLATEGRRHKKGGSGNDTYTVVFSTTGPNSGNSMRVSSGALVWVLLRMYAANADPRTRTRR